MSTLALSPSSFEASDPAGAERDRAIAGAIRVYLTDDDQQFSVAVRDLLEGHPDIQLIGAANSVEQMLTDIPAKRVDVLVLDLYMPAGESLEGIADVRNLVPGIKVLVITGGGWADQQVASILAGANGFLYKPFTSSDLVHAVRVVHSGKVFFDFSGLTGALNAPGPVPLVSDEVLSPEDREFLELIRQGMTTTGIAALWKTGIKAVYQRRYRLKTKLGLHSARDLARVATAVSASGDGSARRE